MTLNDNQEPEISGGYLLEIDGFAYLGSSYFISRKGIPVSIIYPEDITEEQKNYIVDKFNELEKEIYDNNLTRIDIKSFAKYFILEELIGNDMAFWRNYIYKNRNDESFYFGPIWDNELSLENDKKSFPTNCKTNYAFNYGISAGSMAKFVNKLLKNEEVREEIKQVLKNIIDSNILNINDLNNYIDETAVLLSNSRNLNFIKWKILDKQLNNNQKIYDSLEEEIDVIKNFIKQRIIWLQDFILDIKCEGCISCEKDVEPKQNEYNDLNFDIYDEWTDYEVSFQALYFKGLTINILNILSRVLIIFL
jgi:hypothetical protein